MYSLFIWQEFYKDYKMDKSQQEYNEVESLIILIYAGWYAERYQDVIW